MEWIPLPAPITQRSPLGGLFVLLGAAGFGPTKKWVRLQEKDSISLKTFMKVAIFSTQVKKNAKYILCKAINKTY